MDLQHGEDMHDGGGWDQGFEVPATDPEGSLVGFDDSAVQPANDSRLRQENQKLKAETERFKMVRHSARDHGNPRHSIIERN